MTGRATARSLCPFPSRVTGVDPAVVRRRRSDLPREACGVVSVVGLRGPRGTPNGFRPRRSAHQAIAQAQHYIADGCGYVVDFDLEKFFDQVSHDRLMGQVARRVADKRLLTLIRAFLNAGVRENGLVGPRVDEGVPQGGPLSPVLSNLVLDEFDRELERRGHRFVRYADDCNVYVGSVRAGQRVMESITHFITTRLKLKVNRAKSAVGRPQARTFLGFSFTGGRW